MSCGVRNRVGAPNVTIKNFIYCYLKTGYIICKPQIHVQICFVKKNMYKSVSSIMLNINHQLTFKIFHIVIFAKIFDLQYSSVYV